MTTKLARIGLRANTDIECVFNNLGHVLDINLLREQYDNLDGRKAVGIDGTTKAEYGKHLDRNLDALIKRIRTGTYKPQPTRLVEIPKEDGSSRPLAIACFEDKLVQSGVSAILTEIYEPLFLPCSYGFRPNRSAHDALRALMCAANRNRNGAVVEIDIKKYFNTIPTDKMLGILSEKISDKRFLRLIQVLMQTPTVNKGKIEPNLRGCPQGSIISPVLANVYLHYVIDKWFKEQVKPRLAGHAEMIRYADDMVFTFQHKHQAERLYRVLPKRLNRFGLELHAGKSQLLESGGAAAERADTRGEKLITYQFLGFTCYWGKARRGFWRLKYSSRADRFSTKLQGLRTYLWRNLNTDDVRKVLIQVVRIIKGWINYHAISDNNRRVKSFILKAKRTLFKWFNRRGGKKRVNWDKFSDMLKRIGLPEQWKLTTMFTDKPK